MSKRLLARVALAAILTLAHAAAAQTAKKKKKPPAKPPATQPAPESQPADQQQPIIEIEPDTQPAPAPAAPAPGTPSPASPPGTTAEPAAADTTAPAAKAGAKLESWQDVVVVVRKPFLKNGRFELQPLFQVTLNDNMIRHYAPTGEIIYWLTDVLGVGVEGQYYTHFDTFLESHELVKEDYRRLPTLNEYVFGAALDFHYVPIYAKFAMFNKYMVHWEGMFSIGVGVTETRILPRNPDPVNFPAWENWNITPNIGFQLRFFLTSWITFNIGVKDYIFVDKFESVMRTATQTLDQAKDAATSQLINNIMFGVGISLWVPPTFNYTTFR